jgi:osmotically-inducible protein OsmY
MTYYNAEPPVRVYGWRSTEDQLITNEVVNTLANDPRLSGYIGVETRNREVSLYGRVTTPGQVERAERDARSVDGVRDVHNYVRPKVGEF